MTVFVRNAEGVNVPADIADTTATTNTATTTEDTTTPTATNPTKIGAWTTADRTIPATMDYSPFTYRGGVDYNKVLSAMYGARNANPNAGFLNIGNSNPSQLLSSGVNYTPTGGMSSIGQSYGPGAEYGTASLYVDPNKKGATGSPIAFADEGWNQIIDEARKKINNKLYSTNIMGGSTSLNNKNLDVALLNNAGLTNEKGRKYGLPDIGVMGLSPLEAYGGTDEQQILQKIAEKYNVSVNDIVSKDTQLQRAMNQYYDPVSANWQDVTASPWGKDVTTGVQKWSGLKGKKDADGNTYFDNLNAQLGENPALSAEYFALHGRPEQLGGTKTSGMKAGAYKYTGWEDFLPAGVTPLTATSAQITAAANAYNAQSDLLKPWLDPTKYDQAAIDKSGGSYFDLFKSEKLPVPKGYSYAPNAALTRYNEAVNAGVNPEDLGYDASKVYKGALEKDSGMLGGTLGKIAQIASFVPGPIGATARVLSAMNSFSEGNIVGGVTGMAGATGLTGQITNSLGESLMSNFPTELADMAAKFNMTPSNFAQMLSNSAVNAGISGINAGVNGGNVFGAMLTGGSMPIVSQAIDAQLRGVVTNPDLRKFITTQTANALARTAQGGSVLPFDIGSSGGSQQRPPPSTTTTTTTSAKEGETKMAGGVEYTYNNGVWVPA
jgi:hypothetical protein